MLTGQVTANREAIMRLLFLTADGGGIEWDAIVDTGFTEYVTLPAEIVAFLSLPLLYATAMTLAGGETLKVNVYEASLVWNGQPKAIKVHSVEGDALVGMALLYGSRLTLDVVDGGAVTIDALP